MIAAIGQNNELGKNGELIWPIKKDLKFFRQMTMGHDIIMGRKTFESLPRLLKGRRHVVLSRGNLDIEGIKVYHDIQGIIMDYKDKDAFVIGGASLYEEFIDYTDNIYLTLIEASCMDADTFFPSFEKRDFKRVYLDEDIEDGLLFRHVLYKRR